MYPIDVIHFECLNINLYFDSVPLASSPWQTMDNHEVMLIIVADLDKFFRTKKDKVHVFLSPNNIILNQKHNTFLSLISLINEVYMFQTQNL